MSEKKSDSKSSGGVRRRSREMTLQLLFQREYASDGHVSGLVASPDTALKRFIQDFEVEKEVAEYGSQLFLGVSARIKDLDAVIQASSVHWKIPRMGLVDLTVMRIAVYEMKFADPIMQPNIAIDEAVEIAKKFGSTDSGAFVNGILDHIKRNLTA